MKAPPSSDSVLDYRNLFRWARESVAGLFGPFVAVTVLSIVTSLLAQYNVQLLTNFVRQANPPAAGAHSAQGGLGILALLVPGDIRWTAVLFAVTAILLIACGFANRIGSKWFSDVMIRRLQLRLHDKLLRLGFGYHSRHDMGENTALVLNYATGATPMFRDVLAFPFVHGIPLATAIALLFFNLQEDIGQLADGRSQGVAYALLMLLLLVLPAGGVWLSRNLRKVFANVRDQQSALANVLVDSLTAPQEVQLMNAAPQRSAAFGARLRSLSQAQLQSSVQNEISSQFQAAIPTVLQIGLILWAAFLAGESAVASIIAIYYFVPRIVEPIQQLIGFYSNLNVSWPNIERIGQVLDAAPEIVEAGSKTASEVDAFEVRLEDVTVRPDGVRTILDGVSATFLPGKVTALVGRAGSGKTTILRLIVRLMDPVAGRVTIGGVDVRDIELGALRRISATVSQFPLFIEATVRENLRLAGPTATDEQMEMACRAADVWEALVKASPSDPLSTMVPRLAGKSGLSGGERRRLAIARGLLSDAPILLLDEPSTGIDAVSVGRILAQLRSKPDRITLLVDHDVDVINAVADEILCLEDGKFSAVGTPEALRNRPGLFRTLLESRRAYATTGDIEVLGSVPVRPAVDGPSRRDAAGGVASGMRPEGKRPGSREV